MDHLQRQIAAALAFGIKRHLMHTYKGTWTLILLDIIYTKVYLLNNIINRNRSLLEFIHIQELEITSLQNHAWLATHTWLNKVDTKYELRL